MNAVGIDVSKGKSTVAILRLHTDVGALPFDVPHTVSGMKHLVEIIRSVGEDPIAFMEHTGRFYESVAQMRCQYGILVVAFNPLLKGVWQQLSAQCQDRQGGCKEDRPLWS